MKWTSFAFLAPIVIILSACSSSDEESGSPTGGAPASGVGGGSSTGGAPSSGGGDGLGGSTAAGSGGLGTGGHATGGVSSGGTSTGGAGPEPGTGGATGGTATGGSGGTGGVSSGGANTGGESTGSATGGMTDTGGSPGSGGAFTTGGTSETGGMTASGGAGETGGASQTGGSSDLGGSGGLDTGGAGGSTATGGADSGSGGASTGGAAAAWPTCSIPDSDLEAAFTAWEGAYVTDCGGNGKRVVGCGASTCSEAMGYGMLIAVNMGRQELFDSLLTFVHSLIPISQQGSFSGRYLLPWSIGGCDGASDYNNATDGDLDIAMSLVQADARWPGNGYLDAAIPIIRDIMTYNTTTYSGRRVLLAGDGTLQPAENGNYPSYFAPGYYRVFSQVVAASSEPDGAELAAQYLELANATYELFDGYQAAMTNKLWPEFANLDGTLRNGDQGYWWNACRTPWRIAADWAWFGSADAERQLTTAAAANADPYAAAPEKNSAFVGGLIFLHMPAGQAAFETACSAWLGAPSLADGVYFQDSLKLLYMLLASGHFPSGL